MFAKRMIAGVLLSLLERVSTIACRRQPQGLFEG